MKIAPLMIVSSLFVVLSGCSKDYTPEANTSGEQVYQAACAGCHVKNEQGNIFTFDKANANKAYIAERVKNGNLRMPKFPNIQGESLNKLSDYLLSHSGTK